MGKTGGGGEDDITNFFKKIIYTKEFFSRLGGAMTPLHPLPPPLNGTNILIIYIMHLMLLDNGR